MTVRRAGQAGFTLVELVCVSTLLVLMAGMALPVAHVMERRARELELKQTLRRMRRAIDAYHWTVKQVPSAKENATAEDWPEDLDVLVEGLDLGLAKEIKVKFLRRIPVDPLTGEAEWDEIQADMETSLDPSQPPGIWDVRSRASGQTLDGIDYSEL